MKIMKIVTLVLAMLCILLPVHADTLSLYFENDVLHNQDYYYTTGWRVSYLVDAWDAEVIFGQDMYTSYNKWTKVPDKGDRPYAGWLYLGMDKTFTTGAWRHYVEAAIGVTGSMSLAGQTQTFVHELIDNHVPEGWDSQVPSRLAGILYLQESRPLFDSKWVNLIPHADFAVGNVQTFAGGGATIEFGWNIENQVHNQITVKSDKPSKWNDFRCYLFGDVQGRYVLNNITLEDNPCTDYPYAVDVEPWVADLSYGACVQYDSVKLMFTTDWRTKEFTTENTSLKPFSGVKLSVSF